VRQLGDPLRREVVLEDVGEGPKVDVALGEEETGRVGQPFDVVHLLGAVVRVDGHQHRATGWVSRGVQVDSRDVQVDRVVLRGIEIQIAGRSTRVPGDQGGHGVLDHRERLASGSVRRDRGDLLDAGEAPHAVGEGRAARVPGDLARAEHEGAGPR